MPKAIYRSGDFIFDWNGKQTLAWIERATGDTLKQSAKKIRDEAREMTPVGKFSRTAPMGGPSWMERIPGKARESIRTYKSKYKDGGWIVTSGGIVDGYDAYYYRFIELGAPAIHIKAEKPLRKAGKAEEKRIVNRLKEALKI